MTKLRFVFIAAVAAVGFGAAPALADCHCSTDEGFNSRANAPASSVSSAYRGGGYGASHEGGVQILRGKVPANFNAAAAGLQRQAIAEDRAAFTSASRTRAAQQRAAKRRAYAAPRSAYGAQYQERGYRPAYSTLGHVYAIGPNNRSRSRSRRGARAQGLSRGRNATKIRGARRTRSSISFARRIRG